MNKDLLIERMTESSALDESVGAQIAQIGRLDQQRVIKTVIKYGNERIELNLSEKLLKLGLDLHYRQVTVAMQEDGRLVMPVGKMAYRDFLKWIRKKLAQGWQIYSCYEAGASGYWLDRKLRKIGVANLVVVPKAMGQGGKKQKTDRRDSCQLVDDLDRYMRGNEKALSVVGVPSEEQEEKRALIRYQLQIMGDRKRCEARGKGLLCSQGIEVHGVWWSEESWQELMQNPALKDWMKEQLEGWRTKALRYEQEQNQLRKRIEALAPESSLPKGVGRYSWAVLEYEMKGWARFDNRRQVGSYTGLCPGVHRSDNRGKEGSINRCGNPIVRWTLIEMVWRLVRWQPDYPPIRQLVKGLVRSKRAKKRLVVMAARHLAMDLWRLATGQTTAEKLGLVF
jgi:transposase